MAINLKLQNFNHEIFRGKGVKRSMSNATQFLLPSELGFAIILRSK